MRFARWPRPLQPKVTRMAPIKPKTATKLVKEPTAQDATAAAHIGATLKQAREARDMTVEQIADELMIRRFYLDALEQGNFKDLPERVYATGFVRSYAQFMGLDPQSAVDQFKRDAYGTRNGPYRVELTMPEPIIQNVMPSRTALVSAAAAVCVIAIGIFLATRSTKPATSAIPEPPVAADITSAPVVAPDALSAPTNEMPEEATPQPDAFQAAPSSTVTPEAPAAAAEKAYFLEATQSAWVEVKDAKGVVLFSNILKQGQKLPIPNQTGLTLSTGNAGGLRFIFGDQPQEPVGKNNEVKRSIPIVLDKR